MTSVFTEPDAWSGGSYELALLYESVSPDVVHRGLVAAWSGASVDACYLRNDVEPADQAPVSLDAIPPDAHLFGVCTLAGEARVAARSLVVPGEGSLAWLYFGFPMGSLGRAYPVGAYPFADGGALAWRDSLDAWLCQLAQSVFRAAPFKCGLIAWEPEESVGVQVVESRLVPSARWEGVLLPDETGLSWYPPTEGAPLTVAGPGAPPTNRVLARALRRGLSWLRSRGGIV